ncbi:MAG: hypothetical protein KA270_00910 [Saprospiraceae bacterium]|nr:hypothetical protein [Saprospiraceae bacterium]MBP6565689.1 hypothetical protein [Saprospiraceae bacterium]
MPTKPSTPINRLILIGNGFDLAHGLKTSYGDFIFWYFQKSWNLAKDAFVPSQKKRFINLFKDDLISISVNPFVQQDKPLDLEINNHHTIKEFVKVEVEPFKPRAIKCKIESDLFISLVNNFLTKNWVDIENHYYEELTKIITPTISYNNPKGKVDFTKLTKLNKDFDSIKKVLEVYLSTLKSPSRIDPLENIIYELPLYWNTFSDKELILKNLLLLNFNYTDTPKKYKRLEADIIYIHGKLKDEKNPIIFGYGDERDESYTILEKANNPEVFSHIKSFDYLKTNNYSRLLAFLETPFEVYIMGHSCGLSDRTLLSSIFEHDNCRLIKIFYYNDIDRYRETTYEISRHFTSKAEMRRKVINFSDCTPMPQLGT